MQLLYIRLVFTKKNMKLLIVFIITGFTISAINAQDTLDYWRVDTSNHFNQPHYPFSNSLTMWILKQRFSLDIYQMELGREMPIGRNFDYNQTRMTAESYLPIFKYKIISSTIGVSYSKSYILSDNDSVKKSLHENCYIWLPLQYQFKRLKIILLYENFYLGDNSSLYSHTSNMQRGFINAIYPFNSKWHLMLIGSYTHKKLENEIENFFIPAFQLRYQPNNKIQLIGGAPILFALDWQISNRIDISFSQFMVEETDVFLRYNISKRIGLSLHYLLSNHSNSEIFFNKESISFDNKLVTYNNLAQNQNLVSIKLGIKTFNDIGLIITGGYNFGGKINLYEERTLMGEINGSDEFYLGLSLQYLKFK